jgi:hypothetical protein
MRTLTRLLVVLGAVLALGSVPPPGPPYVSMASAATPQSRTVLLSVSVPWV